MGAMDLWTEAFGVLYPVLREGLAASTAEADYESADGACVISRDLAEELIAAGIARRDGNWLVLNTH